MSTSIVADDKEEQGPFAIHDLDDSVALCDGNSVYTVQSFLSHLRIFLESPECAMYFNRDHVVVIAERPEEKHGRRDNFRGGYQQRFGRPEMFSTDMGDSGGDYRPRYNNNYGSDFGDRGDRGGHGGFYQSQGGFRGDRGGDSFGSRDPGAGSYGRHRSRGFGMGMSRKPYGSRGGSDFKRDGDFDGGFDGGQNNMFNDRFGGRRGKTWDSGDTKGGRGGRGMGQGDSRGGIRGGDGNKYEGENSGGDRGGYRQGGRGGMQGGGGKDEPIVYIPAKVDETTSPESVVESGKDMAPYFTVGQTYSVSITREVAEEIDAAQTTTEKEAIVRKLLFLSNTISKKFVRDYLEVKEKMP